MLSDKAKMRGDEKTLLGLMAVAILMYIAFHVSPLWGYSYLIWYAGLMGMLALLAFINITFLSGLRNAIVFLVLGAIIGFLAEYSGVQTGALFGPYKYTSKLGPELASVPIVVPLCWFAAVYFSHTLANLIVRGRPILELSSRGQIVAMAALTGMLAAGFDVAIDPVMSNKSIDAWTWTAGGDFFGVPFKNFQGWLIVSFAIDLLYRLFVARWGVQPVSVRHIYGALCAIAAWASLAIGFMLIGNPVESQLIAAFTILLPAITAFICLCLKASEPVAGSDG